MIDINRYKTDTTKKREVLQTVYERKSVSRVELTETLNLSLTSITKFVGMLIEDGIIIENGSLESTGGRKTALLGINPEYAYNLGIDIGAFAAKFAVVRMDGTIVEDWFVRLKNNIAPVDSPESEIIDPAGIHKHIKKIFEKYDKSNFMSICVAISGMVDYEQGTVIFSPNIIGWNKVDIAQLLKDKFGIPAFADTSARCMALAEQHFGEGIGVSNQLFIALGTYSISSAMIFDSKIYRGSSSFSGEIGHVTASNTGLRCSCGNYDCLELTATMMMFIDKIYDRINQTSGLSPIRQLFPENGTMYDLTPEIVQKAIESGDKLCYETMMEGGVSAGTAISNLLNVLNPELVILGGGVVDFFPKIIDIIKNTVRERTLIPIQQNTEIKKAKMDWHGAVAGSTVLAMDKFFK